jgi:hypothetical protein
VHISKETWVNVLSPKSELMVYLGCTEGIKASTFMQLSNNTVYTSTTALFDETLFLKCKKSSPKGTTCLNEPKAPKPSNANQDTTLGDLDNPLPPFEPKRDAPVPDRAQEAPEEELPAVLPSPPMLEPVPLRRSARLRKVPTQPNNAYGEHRHPTDIEKGIRQTCT